jgi:hypothetical protein
MLYMEGMRRLVSLKEITERSGRAFPLPLGDL